MSPIISFTSPAVHYQAWTASSGDEIDNTREGHEAHQILLAQGESACPPGRLNGTAQCSCNPGFAARGCARAGRPTGPPSRDFGAMTSSPTCPAAPADRAGLVLGLLSMAEGERALLNVSSELAYGQEGHFSFPARRPRSTEARTCHLAAPSDFRGACKLCPCR